MWAKSLREGNLLRMFFSFEKLVGAKSDEQMSKGLPFFLLNDEQMSNKVGG